MKSKRLWLAVSGLLLGVVAVGLLPGCEVGSPNNVVPTTAGGNFSGYYSDGGSDMVTEHSGAAILSLTISQSGTDLQAVDNNGILFKGTLSTVVTSGGTSNTTTSSSSATFSLQGTTTTGAKVTVSGQLSGANTTATLSGIWAEPTLYGTIYGTASIPTSSSSSTTAAITATASPSSYGTVSGGGTYAVGTTVTLTALPNSGHTFTTWNDGVTTNPRTITVPTGGATYTATFN